MYLRTKYVILITPNPHLLNVFANLRNLKTKLLYSIQNNLQLWPSVTNKIYDLL